MSHIKVGDQVRFLGFLGDKGEPQGRTDLNNQTAVVILYYAIPDKYPYEIKFSSGDEYCVRASEIEPVELGPVNLEDWL